VNAKVHASAVFLLLLAALPVAAIPLSAAELPMAKAVSSNRAWAERAFGLESRPGLDVHRLTVVEEAAPGESKLRSCAAGGPLRLGDKTYPHGLGVNSPSIIRVDLAAPADKFEATIGLDRNVDKTPASVRFLIKVGGRTIHSTGVVRPGAAPLLLAVPLDGARSFDLVVDDGGDGRAFDQADWAEARVCLQHGITVWLDDMAFAGAPHAWLPFSFVYGGQASSSLLGAWTRTVTEAPSGANAKHYIVKFLDPDTRLEVRADVTVYTDTPGVDWIIHFVNQGTRDTPVLEQVNGLETLTWLGALTSPAGLFRLKGSVAGAEDWTPIRSSIGTGARTEFAPVAGRSSQGASPFFTVHWADGGVVTAVGWSGQWSASVSRAEGPIRMKVGLPHLKARLRPGESVRSPRILQVRWSDGDEAVGHNLFRRTMLSHIVPKVRGQTVTPPIAHLSDAFYEMDNSTEEIVLSYVRSVEGLGFETFWHDAYFGVANFPTVGNYVLPLQRSVNSRRFPRGLKPVGDAVHGAGMKYLQWFEPERICPGTLMATEHPEWVVIPPGAAWGGLDLGNPAALAYVTDYLIAAIREYGVDQLRIDNAVDYAAMWRELDSRAGADRGGIAENRYVEGLYALWDRILAEFPDLFIDNCASGGQRIDLETCARSIPLWRTDGTIGPLLERRFEQAAVQNQLMTISLNRYLPFHVSGQMGASPYLWRSGFNGGIAFCEDVRPAGYPKDLLRQAIGEGKRIRKYYFGDFYPLSEETGDARAWCVMQFDRPEQGEGMVMAFRRERSPYPAFSLESLCGIDPAATYRVTESPTYTPGKTRILTGRELLRTRIDIEERPASALVEYKKVTASNTPGK
jgi:alpha-galactosidase